MRWIVPVSTDLNRTRIFLAMTLAWVIALSPAQALPGSPFEGGDGNLDVDSGTDWATYVGSPELRIGYDLPSGQNDNSLKGKEDDPAPEITYGSIPNNKNDLLRFYVTHETQEVAAEERDFLYLAWVRDNILGTALMDFEFNQSTVLSANGVTPERTAGDMLITYEFSSGGNQVNLGLHRWVESGACQASTSPPCWGPRSDLNGYAEAAVNEFTNVFDPIEGVTLPALTFGEAAIDLTESGVFGHDQCVSFGSAYVKSRSSDSFTASMKDFISPIDVSVSNCATIIISKDAVPDETQDFTFTPSAELDESPFLLDDDGDEGNDLASSKTYYDRYNGTYTVMEEGAEGWDLTGVSCTDGGVAEMGTDGKPTGLVTVDVVPGDRVECVYTNTRRGRILVDKVTYPSGDLQPFDFNLSGGPDGIDTSFQLADGTPAWDSGTLPPGTYNLAETIPVAGWDLTDAVCSDGSSPDAIDLAPGETVTCTFTNTKRGQIFTDKVTYPAADPASFDFNLTGGPDAVNDPFSLTDQAAARPSALLRPGAYSLAEVGPAAGWDLTGAVCSDGSPPDAIDLAPGEIVTCTFTNTKRGKIVTDKVTYPAGDPASFAFTLTGGPDAVNDPFNLTDEATPEDSGFLKPGTYALAETDPGGEWDLTNATCDDGSSPDAIDLTPGETVTCTFTNTKRGKIVTDKVTYPSADPASFDFTLTGGPDAVNDPFALTDEATPEDSGFLKPGTYALAETDPGEVWDLTGTSCSDGSPVDAIDLAPGETVTCTFTNTKRGNVLVDKVTYPAGDPAFFGFNLTGGPDGTAQFFELADATAAQESGPLKPGTYSVEETDPGAEWDLTGVICSDGSLASAIDLAPGETVTCTFTNTKRGKILTDKITYPVGDPASFGFTLTGGPDAVNDPFALTDEATPEDSGFLKPGTYALAEDDPGAEWDLTGTSCSDGSPIGAIDLAPGETVTCSFTNTRRGRILTDKVTYPAGDPTEFGFDLTGGPEDMNESFSLADTTKAHDSGFIKPGTYALAERDAGEAWDLTGAVCSDGSPVDAIVVDPGETVTCTCTNTKRVRLTVVKKARPEDPDDFEFNAGGPELSETFLLDDDGDATDDPGQGKLPDRKSWLEIPGLYTLTENDAGEAWDATGLSCTDASDSPVGSIDLPGRTATVDLGPGEEATCVFTNTKRGKIVVEKRLAEDYPAGDLYDPAQQLFDFSTDYGDPFQLRHGETNESAMLLPDRSYRISEAGMKGWVATSTCTYPDGSTVEGGSSINVDLAPGAEVHCVFVNEMRIHPGTIGFWRNWRNHYDEETFRRLLADALDGSPVYAHLFDWGTGELIPDAVEHYDEIFDYTDESMTAEQKVISQFTATMMNLGVSTSDDPDILALQMHDDICLECAIDILDAAAETLIRDLAPCELDDPLRVTDPVSALESVWTGNLSTDTYTFGPLTEADQWLVGGVFDDINNGRGVKVDPDSYPDDPAGLPVDGPVTHTWYRDADGDGHGLLEDRIQTCDDTMPDGYATTYTDCDDTLTSVYPGAEQFCDGVNNDCNDPAWPAVPVVEIDDDGDAYSDCAGDCDDGNAAIYPNALQDCDGINNDCNDPAWPALPADEADADGDSFALCDGDCDDGSSAVHPGAFQACDGINNDCDDPAWPAVPADEVDADGDGYAVCDGDCDDDATRHPGIAEACNQIDDNCNGLVDEGPYGEDSDNDTVADACDVCPEDFNPNQNDRDRDGIGDGCDNCANLANSDQEDLDVDGFGDVCDNCPETANPHQDDLDLDGVGDVCDNCADIHNTPQSDVDADGEGDHCDVNDGVIYVLFSTGAGIVEWQDEQGFHGWNAYKGDLADLRGLGLYTQQPGSNDLAQQYPSLLQTWIDDALPPASGQCAHFLVTGLNGGRGESGLGTDSSGNERPNDNPCP